MNEVNRREIRLLMIVAIALAIVVFLIAYAFRGDKQEKRIYITNLTSSSVGSIVYSLPEIQNTVISNYYVLMKKPGDTVTLQMKLENDSDYDMVLKEILQKTPSCLGGSQEENDFLCDHIRYEIFHEDGSKLTKGETVYANSSEEIKVVLQYSENATKEFLHDINIDHLGIDFLFVPKEN